MQNVAQRALEILSWALVGADRTQLVPCTDGTWFAQVFPIDRPFGALVNGHGKTPLEAVKDAAKDAAEKQFWRGRGTAEVQDACDAIAAVYSSCGGNWMV